MWFSAPSSRSWSRDKRTWSTSSGVFLINQVRGGLYVFVFAREDVVGPEDVLFIPEGEWSEEDRGLEQEKMEELVNIIEQRNQIISSLDEDAKRWSS